MKLPSAIGYREILAVQRASRMGRARNLQDPRWRDFRAYPSCPPSSVLHITGGWLSSSCWYADAAPVHMPSQALDLSIASDTLFTAWPTFAAGQEGYYTACWLLVWDWQPSGTYGSTHIIEFNAYWGTTPDHYTLEIYPSAAEAEQALDRYPSVFLSEGVPICALVLRNNGQALNGYCFEPIGRLNRGGSYLYHNVNWRGKCVA